HPNVPTWGRWDRAIPPALAKRSFAPGKSAAEKSEATGQTRRSAAHAASGPLRPDTAKGNPPRRAHIPKGGLCHPDGTGGLSMPADRQISCPRQRGHSQTLSRERKRSAHAPRFAPDRTVWEASLPTVPAQLVPEDASSPP